MSDDLVSDSDLAAAIMAFEKAIHAMSKIPDGLSDCDKIAVRAMKELQEWRRTLTQQPSRCRKTLQCCLLAAHQGEHEA